MKRIEFIGAGGAGKSTLLDCMLRARSRADAWMTPAEAEVRIARGLRPGALRPAWRKGLWALLQLRFPRRLQPVWADRILRQYDAAVFDGMPGWARELMDFQIRLLAGPPSASDAPGEPADDRARVTISDGLVKARAVAYSLETLLRIARLASFGKDFTVVYDDAGLLQNQLGIDDEAWLHAMAREGRLEAMLPCGLVFCELPPDELFRRRKERIANGRGQFTERRLSDDDLRSTCRNMVQRMETKARAFQKIGVPTLVVPMAESPARNAETVLAFIRERLA